MNTIVVQADSKVSKALIAIFKAMNLTYEVKKSNSKDESTYDPEFVKKVLEERNKKGGIIYDEDYKKRLFQDL